MSTNRIYELEYVGENTCHNIHDKNIYHVYIVPKTIRIYPYFMDTIKLHVKNKHKAILEIFGNDMFLMKLNSENNIFYPKIPSCSTPYTEYSFIVYSKVKLQVEKLFFNLTLEWNGQHSYTFFRKMAYNVSCGMIVAKTNKIQVCKFPIQVD
jgi:hypothetical protein